MPTPLVAPRKKVQFLMMKDSERENETNATLEGNMEVAEVNEIIHEPKNFSKSEPEYERGIKAKEPTEESFSNDSFTNSKSDFSKSK